MHRAIVPFSCAPALAAMALGAFAGTLGAAGFPQASIDNGSVRATLYLPDTEKGYYRATRFDWSGVIASLECAGHTYFGVWFPKYDPKLHDSITGPVEEYRTGLTALGYDDARPGGTFIRIGVGVLRKPQEPQFQQFETYEIVDPGKWTIHAARDSVEFIQTVADPSSGYAYELHKIVRLVKNAPQMQIEHILKNTGKRVIETNVYNHDFFVIDGQPTGPDFSARFPFELRVNGALEGPVELHGKEVAYPRELQPVTDRVFGELTGFRQTAEDFDIHVENRKTGAGVRLTGDQPLWKLIYWSVRSALSPEVYINLKIEPGHESRWRLTYDFYTLPHASAN